MRTIQRVERHIFVNNKKIDNICFLSKNLYNYCNYILRQVYLQKLENILDYKDLVQTFAIKDKIYYKINEYDLTTRLAKLNQIDYRALPIASSQQIVKQLFKNWKTFFKLIKSYYQNKTKFKGKPCLPKYKDKLKGRNIVIFTNQQAVIKNEFINFTKDVIDPIKTKVKVIDQVRVIPKSTCYIVEVIYTKETKEYELDNKLYLGIDLGINNLATCVNNTGEKPFIVNGKIIKSINQYYNKKKAYLQSIKAYNKIKKLTHKRNNKIEDYFHKSSRFIINYCLKFKIKTIVVGKNDGWKNKVNLKKSANQNFVCVPHNKLISMLRYKGEEVGIEVIETEESYTSKCSFVDLEEMVHQVNYLGKRVNRGLFRSKNGEVVYNADVNGAYNIIRKVVPAIFDNQGIEGLGLNPISINCC